MSEPTTKEKLVTVAIALIDERGGALQVSMREIARRAGCAAPNVYNHFPDFAALLNAAHLRIIADFNERVPAAGMAAATPAQMIEEGTRAFIRYAIEHRGWFNCFHYERHRFALSFETDSAAEDAGDQMVELVRLASDGALNRASAGYVTRVMHQYTLGELSAVVSGRHEPPDIDEYVERLTGTCLAVFRALVEAPTPELRTVLSW
jgi:AcrR family transcriptional regulator